MFKFLTHQETKNLLITTEFIRDKQIDFSPLEQMIQFEDPRRIINNFASVWPKLFRQILTIKFSEKNLLFFEVKTHIYRPIVPVQNSLKRSVFSKSFSETFSLVIDHTIIFLKSCDFSKVFLKFLHC